MDTSTYRRGQKIEVEVSRNVTLWVKGNPYDLRKGDILTGTVKEVFPDFVTASLQVGSSSLCLTCSEDVTMKPVDMFLKNLKQVLK